MTSKEKDFIPQEDDSNSTNTTKQLDYHSSPYSALQKNNTQNTININLIQNKLDRFIIDTISTVMRLPPEQIKIDTPLATYGIDSLIVLELLKPFKEKFGYLSSTLFFEYPTIEQFRNYLLENKNTEIRDIFEDLDIQKTNNFVNESSDLSIKNR